MQEGQNIELQCKATETIIIIKKCKDGPCKIYNLWEKKGISLNGAGASSRSPIMSNQASQCEDKAALTTHALRIPSHLSNQRETW